MAVFWGEEFWALAALYSCSNISARQPMARKDFIIFLSGFHMWQGLQQMNCRRLVKGCIIILTCSSHELMLKCHFSQRGLTRQTDFGGFLRGQHTVLLMPEAFSLQVFPKSYLPEPLVYVVEQCYPEDWSGCRSEDWQPKEAKGQKKHRDLGTFQKQEIKIYLRDFRRFRISLSTFVFKVIKH